MSQVIMVAQIGDNELHIGKCTHAQARILQKKKHAEVRDGKLFLQIRPVHLTVASHSQFRAPSDDSNVSKAELARRESWLLGLLAETMQAEAKEGQSFLDEIRFAANPAFEAAPPIRSLNEDVEPLTEEEMEAFFSLGDTSELPDLPEDLWGDSDALKSTLRQRFSDYADSTDSPELTVERHEALQNRREPAGNGDLVARFAKRPKLTSRWEFRRLKGDLILVPRPSA